jgi:Fe-S cluster biogenesis protein NfuA
MFIQTEETPNPQTLKFIPGVDVMEEGTRSIAKGDKGVSPLADSLFAVASVESVFLGGDFVTITKSPEADWDTLKPAILTEIMEHFVAGKPVLFEGAAKVEANEDDDEIVATIRELIDTRVRPAVAEDGGDIIFHAFKEGIVFLEMHGACAGCPSSTVTLKEGIENMLKHYVPEVIAVEAYTGE